VTKAVLVAAWVVVVWGRGGEMRGARSVASPRAALRCGAALAQDTVAVNDVAQDVAQDVLGAAKGGIVEVFIVLSIVIFQRRK